MQHTVAQCILFFFLQIMPTQAEQKRDKVQFTSDSLTKPQWLL